MVNAIEINELEEFENKINDVFKITNDDDKLKSIIELIQTQNRFNLKMSVLVNKSFDLIELITNALQNRHNDIVELSERCDNQLETINILLKLFDVQNDRNDLFEKRLNEHNESILLIYKVLNK